MTTKIYSIHDIAGEFDRLYANDSDYVDATEISWGHGTEAGFIGHEHADEPSIVGWYCLGGCVGTPVISIANEDIQRAGEALAALETVTSLSEIERAFKSFGVRFERLV
jgi:hypothetical protein